MADPLTKFLSQAKHDHSLGVNHIAMWTRLLTLVKLLSIGHMVMWTMGVNHINMWTIGVKSHGDVNWIIDSSASGRPKEICPRDNNKVVIYISLYHDKCLLFMLELY